MAMSAVYTTFDGELISEIRAGVESLYVPDTLGSVVEVRNSSGAKVYSAEYWPYGEVQTEAGANPSSWGYVGILGYLKDLANLLYVRARHYRPNLARWQTVDPLWPAESAYQYGAGIPVVMSDQSGQSVDPDRHACAAQNYKPSWNPMWFGYGKCCGNDPAPGDSRRCNKSSKPIDCLDKACQDHDIAIPDFGSYINTNAHRKLYCAVLKCTCNDWPIGSPAHERCMDAKLLMLGYAGSQNLLFGDLWSKMKGTICRSTFGL
jgi:RHS repeat-associated protein